MEMKSPTEIAKLGENRVMHFPSEPINEPEEQEFEEDETEEVFYPLEHNPGYVEEF
jgi:hypothetical protein